MGEEMACEGTTWGEEMACEGTTWGRRWHVREPHGACEGTTWGRYCSNTCQYGGNGCEFMMGE